MNKGGPSFLVYFALLLGICVIIVEIGTIIYKTLTPTVNPLEVTLIPLPESLGMDTVERVLDREKYLPETQNAFISGQLQSNVPTVTATPSPTPTE